MTDLDLRGLFLPPVLAAVAVAALIGMVFAVILSSAGWPSTIRQRSRRLGFWLLIWLPGFLFLWLMVAEYVRVAREVLP